MKTVKRKKVVVLFFVLFFALAWSGPVKAQVGLYSITDLGNLGGPQIYSVDINDNGQIVGSGDTGSTNGGGVRKAFVVTAGKVDLLFNPDDSRSSANSISNGGVIVGFRNNSAFLLGNDKLFVDLGPILGDSLSRGLSVNNTSKVAGYGASAYERGVLWEKISGKDYGTTDIGNFGALPTQTQALSINDSDQIVGFSSYSSGPSRAFRWQKGDGDMIDLGTLPNYTDSKATRINNNGDVIGHSSKPDSDFTNACLWKYDSSDTSKTKFTIINLQELTNITEINGSQAYGINDATVVVGVVSVTANGEERAFIWDATNGMRDLNSLIPNQSDWAVLSAAYAINNKGQIVGYGYKKGSDMASVFLLTPPPISAPDGPFGIDIDIRPWNYHNQINMHARWELIPVAILSDKDFQAPREVVKKSLKFGRTGDEDSLAFCMPWNWDVNHDGRKDLICYFHEGPAKFQCGDTEGILKGKTKDNEEFEGRDLVQVVPCKPIRHHR